jgi:hypothetical protein
LGKQKKAKAATGTRTRVNPLTGQVEQVTGTKAGRKRQRLPIDHPLRTHVIAEKKGKKRSRPLFDDDGN